METVLNVFETGVVTEKDLKGINLWVNKMVRNEELGTWDPIKFWTKDGINGWVEIPVIDETTGRIKTWFRRPVENRTIINFFLHEEDGSVWEEPFKADNIDDIVMKNWAMVSPETVPDAEMHMEKIRNDLGTKFRIKETRWRREVERLRKEEWENTSHFFEVPNGFRLEDVAENVIE